jgi:hypothetical protein
MATGRMNRSGATRKSNPKHSSPTFDRANKVYSILLRLR